MPTIPARYPQLASKILCEPWNISPEHGRTIIGAMLQRLRGERPEEDYAGDPLPKLQIVGDVAVIPLCGTLMMNVPDWVKRCGLGVTDANDIAEELASAVNNPDVALIMLDIDSPGGLAIAGDKLFDLVETAGKKRPVGAWCADGNQMCSSAYEAAAACLAIYAGKYADVGHIGSYCAVLDDTGFWKQLGMEWQVFRSGDLKGIGEDALSTVQKEWIQSTADDAGARFRRNVKKYRTQITPADMQGQWYRGDTAAARGFTAGVVRDLSAAITKLRKLAA